MKREKTHAEVMETAGLLMEVAKAFEELGEAAERIAHGGEAKMDLTPGGSLGRLAERSRKSAGESGDGESWPDPLAEFPRALEALRELAQDGTAAATEGEAGRLFQDEFNKSRRGGWGLLATPRQVAAWRLWADCRACRSVAFVLMHAELGMEGLRGWCTGRVTEAEEKVAVAEAAMHGALAEKWEAIADLPGSKARATAEKSAADERRQKREWEAKAAELAEQTEAWKGAGERLVEIFKRREEDLMRERDREAATAAQLAHALHEAEVTNGKRLDGSYYEEEKKRNVALACQRLHDRLTAGKIAPSSWRGEQAARAVLDEMRAEGRLLPHIQERRLLDLYGKWKREKGLD